MDQKKYNSTIFIRNNDVHQSDEVMREYKSWQIDGLSPAISFNLILSKIKTQDQWGWELMITIYIIVISRLFTMNPKILSKYSLNDDLKDQKSITRFLRYFKSRSII